MAERNLDFDRITDRHHTNSLKYDFAAKRGKPENVLPLWVADMDFPTSSYVQDALLHQVQHGIFGYSESTESYFAAVQGWMRRHHNWKVEESWLVKTPGIVMALAMAVKAYTEPGDSVLIQSPVYYPFSEVIRDNGRKVVSNDLFLGRDNRYHMDLEDFEQKIRTEKIKLFILCSPHNPVGRVWTLEELEGIGEICKKYGVIVVSDEIHSDFVFEGEHHVFANVKEEYRTFTITCTSPSKTFNLAGLQTSNIFIASPKLRTLFKKQLDAAGYSQLNAAGLTACEAAYRDGEEWYQAMHRYVADNLKFTADFVQKRLPEVRLVKQEGTYLVWLDFRKLNLSTEELEHLIIDQGGLWLDSGRIFGDSGKGFQRMNVACPRSVLEEALVKLERAVDGWRQDEMAGKRTA